MEGEFSSGAQSLTHPYTTFTRRGQRGLSGRIIEIARPTWLAMARTRVSGTRSSEDMVCDIDVGGGRGRLIFCLLDNKADIVATSDLGNQPKLSICIA